MVRNNIWIAAADGDESAVLEFLERDPSAVNSLDENGYTVLHAAASYNHIGLLQKLVREHGGNVNIQDHDGDTPLFVTEAVDVARVLVEELHADPNHKNELGLTAADVIEEEGDYPLVAAYLRSVQSNNQEGSANGATTVSLGPNLQVRMSTTEESGEDLPPVDEEFRRRIEELASRGDFDSEEGQADLRRLVSEAVGQHVLEPDSSRNVRPRQDES